MAIHRRHGAGRNSFRIQLRPEPFRIVWNCVSGGSRSASDQVGGISPDPPRELGGIMFSQHLASPAVITPKPPATADRVISYLFADSGLGLLNRIRLNVAPWTRPLRSGRLTFADTITTSAVVAP
jgi:hypothetical protein